jgi:acetyl esterase/lipase
MRYRRKLSKRTKIIAAVLAVIIACSVGILYWYFSRNPAEGAVKLHDLAVATSNIHYCNTSDSGQTLDLYRPKDSGDATLPVVIYIHGGGWRHGDKNNTLLTTYAPLFIKKNVAVVSINYRLNPRTPYPDQNDDVACALTYLDTNAEHFHIDTKRSLYFGDSAGGQLAAFAALTIPYKGYDYEAPMGVIDLYGVSDFSTIIDGARPDLNARRYVGPKYNKLTNKASPTIYVTKKAPRFLFIHGTKDKVVPIAQSKVLFDQLVKEGIDAEYVTISGAGHGFIGPELSGDVYKKIQDNMASFLKETVGR